MVVKHGLSYIKEESRLKVFENRILRRIFGPNKDENGEWRRLHNEELYRLYHSPNKIRVIKSIKWAGHVPERKKVGIISKFQQVNLQERYL